MPTIGASVPKALLAAIDQARGSMTRSEFIKAAVKAYLGYEPIEAPTGPDTPKPQAPQVPVSRLTGGSPPSEPRQP